MFMMCCGETSQTQSQKTQKTQKTQTIVQKQTQTIVQKQTKKVKMYSDTLKIYIDVSDNLIKKCIETFVLVNFKYYKHITIESIESTDASNNHVLGLFRDGLSKIKKIPESLKLKMTHDVWFMTIHSGKGPNGQDCSIIFINQNPRIDNIIYFVSPMALQIIGNKSKDITTLKTLNKTLSLAFKKNLKIKI
jgi:hypothetical protein